MVASKEQEEQTLESHVSVQFDEQDASQMILVMHRISVLNCDGGGWSSTGGNYRLRA